MDSRDFVMELREIGITPHVAQNACDTDGARRRSAIDGRTMRHPGNALRQRLRKRIEQVFGWIKTTAGQRRISFRGLAKVGWSFTLAIAAYNLIRIPKLLAGCDMSPASTRAEEIHPGIAGNASPITTPAPRRDAAPDPHGKGIGAPVHAARAAAWDHPSRRNCWSPAIRSSCEPRSPS